MQSFTPISLIAGALPVQSEGQAAEVVFHAAAYLLDTERVKLCFKYENGVVYYLAADVADFASFIHGADGSGTPLSAILDRDGAMMLSTPSNALAVIRKGGMLLSFSGNEASLRDLALQTYGLEIEDVTGGQPTHQWESLTSMEGNRARKMHIASFIIAMSVATLSIGLLVAVTVWKSYSDRQMAATENAIQASVKRVVAEANAQKLTAQISLSDLGLLMSKAATVCGGEPGCGIHHYRQEKSAVAWEIRVPQWVTQEFMSSLGADIKFRREGDFLVITRGGV